MNKIIKKILIAGLVFIAYLAVSYFYIEVEVFEEQEKPQKDEVIEKEAVLNVKESQEKSEDTIGLKQEDGTSEDLFEKKILSVEEIIQIILPEDVVRSIVQYKVESDGVDGTLAYIEAADNTGTRWVLGYDPADIYNDSGEYIDLNELLMTLIHEYGHIVALNNTQVNMVSPEIDFIECEYNEIIIDEGCAYEGSYISHFVKNFWEEMVREEAYQASLNNTEEDFAYELYNRKKDDFVTEYAATNEIEDMAESFAWFIVEDEGGINIDSLARKKIDFFYSYPRLVSLRTYIRNGMSDIIEGLEV